MSVVFHSFLWYGTWWCHHPCVATASLYEHGQWFLTGKGRRKFLVTLAIILTSGYMNTCI
jgi:hypothetical protein